MKIKKLKGLEIIIDKEYELILAFYAVYLSKHPELRKEFDFIEIPNIKYVGELKKLITIENYKEIVKYLINFSDCSAPIVMAVGIENYEVDYEKIQDKEIEKYMGYGTIEGFSKELKRLANDINWDNFILNHKPFYEEIVENVCLFPKDLNLRDIEEYYSIKPSSYTFIPSVLMNGGFGVSDKKGNLFYNRGFQYNEKKQKFEVDSEYLVECLFHEFSHPIVNPLVDKYFLNTQLLEQFYEIAVKNNLHPVYADNKSTVMYEYLVRANAYILAKKYFKDIMPAIEDDWIIEYGFTYLPDLVLFTENSLTSYKNYEQFVREAIPEFMNFCIQKSNKCI